MKIAVFVSGGGTNLQAIIDRINSGELKNVEIALVIASNDSAYALTRASDNGIPSVVMSAKSYPSREEWDEAVVNKLKEVGAELIVLAGYLSLLGAKTVKEFSNRIINIHPSLIPSFCGTGYYGLKVHEAALERGVKVSGATVHFVDAGTDTGPIILQKAVEVRSTDTPKELQLRIMEQAEWKILPQAIQLIAHDRVKVDGRTVTIVED